MNEKKKSKKKWILRILAGLGAALLILIVVAIIIGTQQEKRYEEVWAFRDTLDEFYFPVQEAIAACVYGEGDPEDYSCLVTDLKEGTKKAKERISTYEVTSDDAKQLKNEILNGITLIEIIIEQNSSQDDTENLDANQLGQRIVELTKSKESFYEHHQKVVDILNKYYH